MKKITGNIEFDSFLNERNPDGIEVKLSIEEMMLIEMLRNKETATLEVKKKEGEVVSINSTDYFITNLANTERIISRYKDSAEVSFTPIGKANYQVKVITRLK